MAGSSDWSAARTWNEQLLNSIRNDLARPPIHARNLYHVSAAMFDAWAVFDENAVGVFSTEKVSTDGMTSEEVKAAREIAVSYAAYRVLDFRFENAPGAAVIQQSIDNQMALQGLDINDMTDVGDSPVAVGNRCAAAVLAAGEGDGSNQANNYAPIDPHTMLPYSPLNDPLVVEIAGAETIVEPNHWAEIYLNVQIDQQGNILAGNTVPFIGPHWGLVDAFALADEHKTPGKVGVYLDPGPPPMLGASELETEEWIRTFAYVVWANSVLSPDYDGSTPLWEWDAVYSSVKAGETMPEWINLSPKAWGNNPLGETTQPGHGPTNPVTGEPYEDNWTRYGDYARIIAEFWADGPLSSTPPGHWNEIANEFLLDNPNFERRMKGTGPVLDDLEWDVKMYLAINGAAHDAAVACWGVKGYYDWTRPLFAIRYMAELGQSTDPALDNYHPHGLPLIPGVIEVITEEEVQPGGKFYHLREMMVDEFGFPLLDPETFEFMWDAEQFIGEIAVKTWPGVPGNPVSLPPLWIHPDELDLGAPYSGTRWLRAKRWSTYQLGTFITPPFAGYTSGHTTFSRAIAEVLTALTGTHYFPGGLAVYHIPQGWLEFEEGPTQDVELHWATYFDCSDQSARSRIYGSIHPPVDDIPARFQGAQIGTIVADRAFFHFGLESTDPGATDQCSFGFWKNNPDHWVGYSPDDNFDSVFGTSTFGDKSLLTVVNQPSGPPTQSASPQANNLGKRAVVALLNAASNSSFPLSEAEVIDLVADALNSGSMHQIISATTYLASLSGQGCPAFDDADLNADAQVNIFDLLDVLSNWGATQTPADITQDGMVNIFDVLEVLSRWGAAPPQWTN